MPCTAPAGAGIDTAQARTLHALVLEDHPHPAGSGPLRRGLFVDCETTGFSSEHDALIELAMLPFDYTLDGHITHVHRDPARTWRQDPGWPVPPEITRITGLTDEDLAGQAIDTAAASELLARSHLVVAHNASFTHGFVADHTALDATVYTDDALVYESLPNPHKAVNHSALEYVRGDVHTNGMGSFWSMLKRAYQGTFHKMSEKHLDRYVREFAGKHSVRDMDTLDIMGAIVLGMDGKRLKYTQLIADNGLDSGARA